MCNCVSMINLVESGRANERDGAGISGGPFLYKFKVYGAGILELGSMSSVRAKDCSKRPEVILPRRADSPPIALRHLPSASNKAFQHGIFMYGSE